MEKADVRAHLLKRGLIEYKTDCFALDYPPYRIPDKFKRYRLYPLVIRFESYYRSSDGSGFWFRIKTNYYSNLFVNEHGELEGMGV